MDPDRKSASGALADHPPTAPPDRCRRLERTDAVLADPRLAAAAERLGRGIVKSVVVEVQAKARRGDIAPSEVVGQAGAPGVTLASAALALPARYAAALRRPPTAVLGRIAGGHCLLDLRAVDPRLDEELAAAVRSVAEAAGTGLEAHSEGNSR